MVSRRPSRETLKRGLRCQIAYSPQLNSIARFPSAPLFPRTATARAGKEIPRTGSIRIHLMYGSDKYKATKTHTTKNGKRANPPLSPTVKTSRHGHRQEHEVHNTIEAHDVRRLPL